MEKGHHTQHLRYYAGEAKGRKDWREACVCEADGVIQRNIR